MNRRQLIAGAALAPLATATYSSGTTAEKIQHHVDEIWKLLKETTPEGVELHNSFFAIGNNLCAAAYPAGYDGKQLHAKFDSNRGGWRATT